MSTCYANPNPIFQPAMRLIASITNAFPALVTTTFANQYKSGLIVRLDIPVACGMQEINGMTGTISVVSDTSFFIDIDTTFITPFSIPVGVSPHVDTCAQVVPVGEVNEQLFQATRNILNANA
jgi:hypothetical protein